MQVAELQAQVPHELLPVRVGKALLERGRCACVLAGEFLERVAVQGLDAAGHQRLHLRGDLFFLQQQLPLLGLPAGPGSLLLQGLDLPGLLLPFPAAPAPDPPVACGRGCRQR